EEPPFDTDKLDDSDSRNSHQSKEETSTNMTVIENGTKDISTYSLTETEFNELRDIYKRLGALLKSIEKSS
ncbi:MAG: hypothetical protein D6767_01020, partial [Candidatus Hydrogenedentota bacterium]